MTALQQESHRVALPVESPRFLPLLLLLFVGSGCAALIYEIVWLQLLQLVIGSSAISLGVLLGTFMGGMCLGSLVLPRITSVRWHPLRVYAFLELGIGAIGIGVLFGLPKIAEMYTNYVGQGTPNILLRAAVAAVCLIPPTLLMGATLPAISRWVESTKEGVSWMGFFYGGNIVGAVFGCLLAGFYLLRVFDMPTATFVAAGINLTVAVIALIFASQQSHRAPSAEVIESHEESSACNGMVYLVIAMSGLTALGAEVVWTRLLSLMFGATVYTFSIILAVFLVGLGIGSSVRAGISRNSRRPRFALGCCQMMLALSVAWAAWVIAGSLPYWPVNPGIEMGKAIEEFRPWYTFQLDLVRAAYAILPGAILWGASFPLALAAVANRRKDPGRMVGGVYAANTLGAIVGSLGFSMLIIPMTGIQGAGTQWAQRILMVLCAISAVLAFLPFIFPRSDESENAYAEPRDSVSVAGLVTVVVCLGAVAVLAWNVMRVPWVVVAFGRNSATWLTEAKPEMVGRDEAPNLTGSYDRYCVYVGEGMNVSVAVTKSSNGYQYFHGAGKVQASSDPQDMRLQRMLGHLSVLAHKTPDEVKDVLVVACGAGVTAGSFIPYPHIQNVTICDIEPLVPTRVTPMFGEQNYHIVDGIDKENPHIVNNKKVAVAYDDGRHFIRTSKDKYDIITSDPIDPWVKGCAALNTVEYYQMCKDHLKPGGVMSLWIPLYECNDDTARSVIGTFFKVFPNGILFSNDTNGEGYDAVLFGRAEETTIDVDEMQKRLDRPEYAPVKQSLVDVGFGRSRAGSGGPDEASTAVDLLATYAGRAADLQEWSKTAEINYDKNLRLQYLAGMWLNKWMSTDILNGVLKYYRFPDQLFVGANPRVDALKQAMANTGRTRFAGQQ